MRQAAVGSAHDFTFVDRQASVDGIRTPLSSSTGTPLEESGTKSHKIDNIATKAIAEIAEARRRCGPTGLQVIAMSRSLVVASCESATTAKGHLINNTAHRNGGACHETVGVDRPRWLRRRVVVATPRAGMWSGQSPHIGSKPGLHP